MNQPRIADVDTLFVTASPRGAVAVADMVDMLEWAYPKNNWAMVGLLPAGVQLPANDPATHARLRFQVLAHRTTVSTGFEMALAVQTVLAEGTAIRRVIMLADTCLITSQNPFEAIEEKLEQHSGIGLAGVINTRRSRFEWSHNNSQLFELGLPVTRWEKQPASLIDDALILTAPFLAWLQQNNKWVPPRIDDWVGTFGTYISWVSQLAGFFMLGWGSDIKPLPPLCLLSNTVNTIAPQLLSQSLVTVFSSLRTVSGYSEEQLRAVFRAVRGTHRSDMPIVKNQPVLFDPSAVD